MNPKHSPLQIIDFAIIDFELKFITPEENQEIDFKGYDVDIDFGLSKDEFLRVFIKAGINRSSEKLPGYSIYAEAACIFKFDETIRLSNEQRNSIEDFSTIYIALNSLRGLVSNVTANAPLGRYILPSVDLNDLINKKKVSLNTTKQKLKKQKLAGPKKNYSLKKIKGGAKK